MHARLVSGVFVALGFADLAVLNLLLAPRLAAQDARHAASAAVITAPPAPPSRAPEPAPGVTSASPAGAAPVITAPGVTTPVPDVLFDLDGQRLAGGDATGDLRRAALALRDAPERRLLVRGHADRLGAAAHNLRLSRWRAEAVQRYLVAQGAPGERIAVEAVGDAEPADTRDTPLAWAKNRRVQILWR